MHSRTHNSSRIVWLLTGYLSSGGTAAVETLFSMSDCLAEAMERASDTTTIGELRRSRNRLFAEFIFENGRYAGALNTWWRIPQADSKDDNPDIDDYMGYFELLNVFTYKNTH